MKKIVKFLKRYKIKKNIPYLINFIINQFRSFLSSVITRVLCYWWHIKIGRNCKFYGVPLFHCHPSGTIDIGDNCMFRSSQWSNTIGLNRRCFLSASEGAQISIGNNCGFSSTVIASSESIEIGDRVLCGANVTIFDTDRHPVDHISRKKNEEAKKKAVIIEDDVWLGLNVVVQKGVRIGKGTIVAANSVVTHSLPDYVVAGGHPAKILKKL